MKASVAFLLFIFSTTVAAQNAAFSTATLRLEIPYLTVNRDTGYEDVELMLNGEGTAFELIDFKKRPQEWNESRNITLAFGQSEVIDENFTVTFRGVFSDNRCPGDVTCSTEGEGVAIFALDEKLASGNMRRILFGLPFSGLDPDSLADRETTSHEFRGIYFTPLVLEPYPVSTESIPAEDYSVTFLLSAITGSCFPDGC